MTTLQEAARMALEALEDSIDCVRHGYETDWRHGLPTRKVQLDGMKALLDYHEDAIEALRTALAQQGEQPPAYWEWRVFDMHPQTVTSGQWSDWKRVEPRNQYMGTVQDRLAEIKSYIDQGYKYQLRALYTATPADSLTDALSKYKGSK